MVRRTALLQHARLEAGSHMGVCSHIHGLLLSPADIQQRVTDQPGDALCWLETLMGTEIPESSQGYP